MDKLEASLVLKETNLWLSETFKGKENGTHWVGSAMLLSPSSGMIFIVIANPGQDRKHISLIEFLSIYSFSHPPISMFSH